MPNLVSLTSLSRELASLTGEPGPSYRSLWEGVVNGELRAVQKKTRWMVDPIQAAEDLGLTIKNRARAA